MTNYKINSKIKLNNFSKQGKHYNACKFEVIIQILIKYVIIFFLVLKNCVCY